MKLLIAIPRLGCILLVMVLNARACGGSNIEGSNKGPSTVKELLQPVEEDMTSVNSIATSNNNLPLDSTKKVEKQIEKKKDLETCGNSELSLTPQGKKLDNEDNIVRLKRAIEGINGVIDKENQEKKTIEDKIKQYEAPRNLVFKFKKALMPGRLKQLNKELEQINEKLYNIAAQKSEIIKQFEQATGQSQVLDGMRQKKT